MKHPSELTAILTVLIFSCKKPPQDIPNKKSPVAHAGTDQLITLPADSIELHGTVRLLVIKN